MPVTRDLECGRGGGLTASLPVPANPITDGALPGPMAFSRHVQQPYKLYSHSTLPLLSRGRFTDGILMRRRPAPTGPALRHPLLPRPDPTRSLHIHRGEPGHRRTRLSQRPASAPTRGRGPTTSPSFCRQTAALPPRSQLVVRLKVGDLTPVDAPAVDDELYDLRRQTNGPSVA